jgi:hypothetical protein
MEVMLEEGHRDFIKLNYLSACTVSFSPGNKTVNKGKTLQSAIVCFIERPTEFWALLSPDFSWSCF